MARKVIIWNTEPVSPTTEQSPTPKSTTSSAATPFSKAGKSSSVTARPASGVRLSAGISPVDHMIDGCENGSAAHMLMMLRNTFRNETNFGAETVRMAVDFFGQLLITHSLEKWKP